jgi:nicotinic acid mononucleotide adenylyltransferase
MKSIIQKALKDFYYHDLVAELYSSQNQRILRGATEEDKIAFIKKAGFFDDELDSLPYNLNFLSTPLDKVKNNIKNALHSPIVLLSTGGFAPCHQGHIDMLELAKSYLSDLGYSVVGGYLSPSHDSYVLGKYNKSIKLTIEERIASCEQAVNDSSWISVCPWEGRYTHSAINFTDVIIRLEKYLKKHLFHQDIPVAYVFGDDNKEFSWAFINKGISVCVQRGDKINFIPELALNKNIHFIDNPNHSKYLSSTQIRNNFKIQEIVNKNYRTEEINNNPYAIRLENKDNDNFCNKLISIFEKTFNNEKRVDKLVYIKPIPDNCISLDQFTPCEYNLQISRLFELSGSQIKSNTLIPRPGKSIRSIQEQVALIPKDKELILIEDDIGSGQTIKTVKELLKDHKIKGTLILMDVARLINDMNFNQNYFDIVDTGDFIVGSNGSGLSCKLPNDRIVRVPYLWPYVSLRSRAKIPANKEKQFNIDVWNLNLELYKNNDKELQDVDTCFQNLMLYVGFKKSDKMSDICKWHLDRINI